MKFHQHIMKILSWSCERQRVEFRHEMARMSATAEDLNRTMTLRRDEIEEALKEYKVP